MSIDAYSAWKTVSIASLIFASVLCLLCSSIGATALLKIKKVKLTRTSFAGFIISSAFVAFLASLAARQLLPDYYFFEEVLIGLLYPWVFLSTWLTLESGSARHTAFDSDISRERSSDFTDGA
ncbi:MAG TPA: hypothetical protein VGM47_00290 [Gammaproteobacteria bacterium]|jgi:hypothetical protein